MGRDHLTQKGAWEAWITFHTVEGMEPYAYIHHCMSIGVVPTDLHDVPIAVCPGCHFEIGYPEKECHPLYRIQPERKT